MNRETGMNHLRKSLKSRNEDIPREQEESFGIASELQLRSHVDASALGGAEKISCGARLLLKHGALDRGGLVTHWIEERTGEKAVRRNG
jgi:hypothetical protein